MSINVGVLEQSTADREKLLVNTKLMALMTQEENDSIKFK